ncbi:MAG: DUF1772 domain-containing protein [Deltaproteobacteria bacterium]|nr:DUF1772 domain-containing protein [Deltaproteobacteria bacterium]MBT6432525.1 DUF1772 domain-containing protein [Deltaproteobacteria bacterium]MBT6490823.1 DUF1772 domain-containing protein [Deltaproteobacteria bacterium]
MLNLFYLTLMLSILLCTLVAGLVFGFAAVVMPGIAKLSDREFLLSFKHMDGIIQNNQPAFMVVWVGSIFSVIATLILGTLNLSGGQLYLLLVASALYLLAVQLPTVRFNIPLNNALQALDLNALGESELAQARADFEAPWNRWNRLRTLNAIFSVSGLLILLLQL